MKKENVTKKQKREKRQLLAQERLNELKQSSKEEWAKSIPQLWRLRHTKKPVVQFYMPWEVIQDIL